MVATDADRGDNAEIDYGIERTENLDLPFNIDRNTGVITTSENLDREKFASYELSVTATDNARDPLTGICRLTVAVSDVNDKTPTFALSEYRSKLKEGLSSFSLHIHQFVTGDVKKKKKNKKIKTNR